MRKMQHTPQFKAKVALEAIQGESTLNELGSRYGINPMQICHWKKFVSEHLAELFEDGRRKRRGSVINETDELYRQIGQLKVELDWLKKKASQTKSAEAVPRGDQPSGHQHQAAVRTAVPAEVESVLSGGAGERREPGTHEVDR